MNRAVLLNVWNRIQQSGIHLTVATIMMALALCLSGPAFTQQFQTESQLDQVITVPGGHQMVNIEVENENLRTVLRDLAKSGGFNLVLDNSVEGSITLGLNKVTINQALQSISTMAGVEIVKKNGNIYLALSKEMAQERGLSRQLSKIINIRYASAREVARVLNQSLFNMGNNGQQAAGGAGGAAGGAGNNAFQKVREDNRTNSIIVVGTQREIELADEAAKKLDKPRHTKTFYLSHGNAVNVASLLSSGLFNDGTNLIQIAGGGAGGAGGGAGGGAAGGAGGGAAGGAGGAGGQNGVIPAGLFVDQETVEEGEGIDNLSGSSGGNGSDNGTSGAFSQNITLRGKIKSTGMIQVSSQGPIIVPDTRSNSVTVMGTVQQIALVEQMIPTLDAQLPQVSIEAALVEISETGTRDLGNNLGLGLRGYQFGFNNQALGISANDAALGNSGIGIPTVDANGNARSAIGFTSRPATQTSDFVTQIRALVSSNRAKLLATPSVVATHDTEAMISIVDEIVRTVETETNGFTTQITTQLGEAGIVLNVLPKVGEDGTVNMRIRPSVSTVRATTTDALGNVITLLNKRDVLAQNVRLKDGETLVIGGLIQESDTTNVDKLPGVADLPIVGALMRATRKNAVRSELVIMITPRILNKTRLTPVNYSEPISLNNGRGF
ncbi:MAG: hypothetical protein KTR14_06500 [Vampirovibrio sp.]|nr:hypothetical protein [Vampirovibrio sp.]